MPISRQCKARKRNGARCEAFAVIGSVYCLTHDPKRAQERRARNRAGGLARIAPKATNGKSAPVISSVADCLQLLNDVISDLWVLENSVPRARGLLAASDAGLRVLDAGNLAERIAALEESAFGKQTES